MRPCTRLSTLVPRLGLISLLFLTSCSHAPKQKPLSPSAAGVIRAVAGAQSAAARLAPHVTPEGKQALVSLEESLVLAQAEVSRYEALVNEQSVARQKAEESSLYWQEKHHKALKELWFWRGLALIGAALIAAWVGWKVYRPF